MKTIDYYLKLPYKLEIVPDIDEGGFVARYPELPGCITVGDTIEAVVKNLNDAKIEWITAALEDGNTIPEPSTYDDYSGQFKLRLPKSLHKLLADQSKEEGVSMNQYCVYLLSMNNASNLYKNSPIR
ncbi:MAG: toxin-antitoxin system HicB family antitoxin [Catonella sp.]|uniref:toxin-antitoxin system HicB family antitoxin n=1 Tax=Catonella sp. TaxID=2382125 RepID=UPI003FA0B37D